MDILDEYDRMAPKWTGRKEGTFAYLTIRDRWPKIVTKLVDSFKCRMQEFIDKHGAGAEEDVKKVLEKLSKLRYLMMTDKALENLFDNASDATNWNEFLSERRESDVLTSELEDEKLTWYRGDWLFVECYLYRYIYGAVYATVSLREFDYFGDSKRQSFTDHIHQVEEAVQYLLSIVAENAPVHETFGLHTMLKMSLWGNRADMSLSGGVNSIMNQSSISASAQRNDFILIDDIDKMTVEILFPLLKRQNVDTSRRIDIILDNAGVELVGDLLLAEYFLSMNFADKVVLHGKRFPWFVSDVTPSDFEWTLDSMEAINDECKKIVERIRLHINEGAIVFECHYFWTYPHAYYEMEKVAPELFDDLKKSSLAIFKGDLNYRKLVGDRDWDLSTSFKTACRGFAPCPFFALRTLKAETVAGLSESTITKLLLTFDDDNSWMTSGEYAVCQLGGI